MLTFRLKKFPVYENFFYVCYSEGTASQHASCAISDWGEWIKT